MSLTLDGSTGISSLGAITTSSSLTTGTGAIYNSIQSGTAVASTSGTTIPFTSIPSWAKRITVMLVGVSTSGTSNIQMQLGSGSTTTTGYLSGASYNAVSSLGTANSTTGLVIEGTTQSASNIRHGQVIISNVTGNTWVSSAIIGQSQTTAASFAGGSITLSGVLDRVVVTTVNGTDTFDAGSINILYE